MTRVGYVWVGALEHSADFQKSLLTERGVDAFYEDISGNTSTPRRPQLTSVLDTVGAGDVLVVWRLDRLGSTTSNVLSLLELLGRRGVVVESIAEEIDTSGAMGEALLNVIGAINELDRNILRERTMVGVYAARERGRVAGRPRALSPTNVERVVMLRDQGASVREIALELGTSRATVYRALGMTSEAQMDADSGPTVTVRLPGMPDTSAGTVSGV
jgi:DNA invertase Pin-like site-specific DNA recombinase